MHSPTSNIDCRVSYAVVPNVGQEIVVIQRGGEKYGIASCVAAKTFFRGSERLVEDFELYMQSEENPVRVANVTDNKQREMVEELLEEISESEVDARVISMDRVQNVLRSIGLIPVH